MNRYKNIFTEKNLSRLMRPHDSRRYKKNIKADRSALLNDALLAAFSPTTSFSSGVFLSTIKGKVCHSIKDYSKVLIIRAITDYLQRIFGVKSPNRDRIVRGVIETLCDSTPMYIIKKDIKSFYESIEILPLDELIFKRNLLPFYTKKLLRDFFSYFCNSSAGIPRGLGLSAVLAEIFLLEFDKKIAFSNGVYKYFRYVDDILIFCTTESDLKKIEADLNTYLPTGLTFNTEKSTPPIRLESKSKKVFTEESIEYLGYEFKFKDSISQKKPRSVDVSIATKKIKKTKTRIVLSIKNFSKNHDEQLLLDRIQFISSNYLVRRKGNEKIQRSKFVKSGIFYNYSLCGRYSGKDHATPQFFPPTLEDLRSLDKFYQTVIGKNSRFKSITSTISPITTKLLKEISFKKGYEKRMIVKFKETRVKDIKKVWKNAH